MHARWCTTMGLVLFLFVTTFYIKYFILWWLLKCKELERCFDLVVIIRCNNAWLCPLHGFVCIFHSLRIWECEFEQARVCSHRFRLKIYMAYKPASRLIRSICSSNISSKVKFGDWWWEKRKRNHSIFYLIWNSKNDI